MKMQSILTLVLLALSVPSFAVDTAKGDFHFGASRFSPVDGIAYQVAGKDGKPITIITLADFKIDRQAAIDAIDPVNAFIAQINANGKGNFVIVRLPAPNRCGVSGLVGNGQQQIDLGEDFASKASVGVARVAGDCSTTKPGKMFSDSYDFHLNFDLPLTAIPKPSPLTAGGGEPGQSYVALVKAIAGSDWPTARIRLPTDQVPAQKPTDMAFFFHGLALNYPKTATVSGGLIKGERATLDIKGIDHDGKKIRGVVAMQKNAGTWRVIEQSLFFDE